MNGQTKPESLITTSDKRIVIVASLVALACTISISNPYGIEALNAILIQAVTLPVGIVMLTLPILIYFGIGINEEQRIHDFYREQQRRNSQNKIKKLLFRCNFQPDEDGTVWEITNANKFGWTNAQLLVERTSEGEKETEKLVLGHLAPGASVKVEANLVDINQARWRVMAISQEGHTSIFLKEKCQIPGY